jgi:hypothetical protein
MENNNFGRFWVSYAIAVRIVESLRRTIPVHVAHQFWPNLKCL